jgi:hypothetical protein
MTVPRLKAMTAYWQHSPPVHMMVAAYLGIGGKKEEKADNMDEFLRDAQFVKQGL